MIMMIVMIIIMMMMVMMMMMMIKIVIALKDAIRYLTIVPLRRELSPTLTLK